MSLGARVSRGSNIDLRSSPNNFSFQNLMDKIEVK